MTSSWRFKPLSGESSQSDVRVDVRCCVTSPKTPGMTSAVDLQFVIWTRLKRLKLGNVNFLSVPGNTPHVWWWEVVYRGLKSTINRCLRRCSVYAASDISHVRRLDTYYWLSFKYRRMELAWFFSKMYIRHWILKLLHLAKQLFYPCQFF